MAALQKLTRALGRLPGARGPAVAIANSASVAVRRTFSVAAEENVGDEQLLELNDKLRSHPLHFRNFPVEEIHFEVGEHFVSGSPHPHVYKNQEMLEAKQSGLHHITPIGVALFCNFGPHGNYGTEKIFPSGKIKITDPQKAELEITLSNRSLPGADGINDEVTAYFDWLQQVQAKYVDHLAANHKSYPALMKKFQNHARQDVLAEILAMTASKVVRPSKLASGEFSPSEAFIMFKNKLYVKSGGTKEIITDIDKDMEAIGMLRKQVPLYNRFGEQIPTEEAVVNMNDVISIESNITCQMYEVGPNVGFGLRKNLRSVTKVVDSRARQQTAGERGSPLGSL